jgi:hypothetical protein
MGLIQNFSVIPAPPAHANDKRRFRANVHLDLGATPTPSGQLFVATSTALRSLSSRVSYAVRRIFPLYKREEPQFRCFVDLSRAHKASCCRRPRPFASPPARRPRPQVGGKLEAPVARRLPRQNLDVKRFPRQSVRSQPPITPAYHRVRNTGVIRSDRNLSRSSGPRRDRRRGMADMDHERAAADRGAVDPFRGQAEIVCHSHRRLAGGRFAGKVAGFAADTACLTRAVGLTNRTECACWTCHPPPI